MCGADNVVAQQCGTYVSHCRFEMIVINISKTSNLHFVQSFFKAFARTEMVSQNCRAVSQNLQIFVDTTMFVNCGFLYKSSY